MRLLRVRVVGFQSFEDSGEITLGPGINLVVGQNNAGKSSLLRALQVKMLPDRHRTPEKWLEAALPVPYTDFLFEMSGDELRLSLFEKNNDTYIPIPVADIRDPSGYIDELLSKDAMIFNVKRLANNDFSAEYPSHGLFVKTAGFDQSAVCVRPINGKLRVSLEGGPNDTIPNAVQHIWETRMFYFSAERLSYGRTKVEHVKRLDSTASNLASVLNTLSGDHGDVFRRLVEHLREIFPSVGNISTRIDPIDSSFIEVRVWPTEAQERPELSFPLSQSGTGVAQVISILTAIMTINKATIIIDEINSFLHPSAVKSLLRIIQTQYNEHQYIISTHAPEVISFGNPASIHLVRRLGYNSSVESLALEDVESLRVVAAHLGVSMADVFAAERVIWVEGETEEAIFPYLYREAVRPVPRGTVFTAVAATGDFGTKRRDRRMVYEAYSKLNEAVATMPVKVVFSFDTEQLTSAEKADMVRDSGGRLHFLPRRHLECYFVDPIALAERISIKDPESTVSAEVVKDKILELGATPKFRTGSIVPDLTCEEWLASVDAAKLLSALFSQISDARIEYDKTTDGIEIVKLMLAREPSTLAPLVAYIASLVDHVNADR